MTKGKNYQRYSAEFKRMALLKASEDGVTADIPYFIGSGTRGLEAEVGLTLNSSLAA